MSSSPVVIVTGANSGVGFGLCQRLLIQLTTKNPPDALANWLAPNAAPTNKPYPEFEGLTLLMACRSEKRAEVARQKLRQILKTRVEACKRMEGYDGYAERLAKMVNIEVLPLDLASVTSIFRFADLVRKRYTYVSHLICNAGVASFTGMDWSIIFRQLRRDPLSAVTSPEFYLQREGEISADGLGWVWQCNVFGHYILFRQLQSLLADSTCPLGARVIWMSSVEASPKFYEAEDWQLVKTQHSYEGSKYQIDLISTLLDRRALLDQRRQHSDRDSKATIRHFVVQPGVASTNISNALVGWFLDIIKVMCFWVARWCGSPHHTISPFKAAVAAAHFSLLPLSLLPAFTSFSSNGDAANGHANGNGKFEDRPVRYGSQTRRNGEEYVGTTEVKLWSSHKDEGEKLLERFENLYRTLAKAEGQLEVETASETM